jgi:hypothetical protein
MVELATMEVGLDPDVPAFDPKFSQLFVLTEPE